MGHRLSKIVTRTGDAGTTGLADGSRVAKDAARVAAMGDVDELNSVIGLLLSESLPEALRGLLVHIQHDLFNLGGELAIPGSSLVSDNAVTFLDEAIGHYNADLPALKEFILPGGCRAAAVCHLARTVARRAERTVVALGAREPITDNARRLLNRLSDLMFVLARWLNRQNGHTDTLWQR